MSIGAVAIADLGGKSLVLNRSYLPVHVTTVRRAFSLLYRGVARAVDENYRTFDFADWTTPDQKSPSNGRLDGNCPARRSLSRGEVALFRGSKAGDWVAFRLPVPQAGRVQISGHFARASDLGRYRLLVDGTPLGNSVDFYYGQGGTGATHVIPTGELNLGALELAVGEHELKFECVGKNDQAAGHFQAADGFLLKSAK